MLSRSEPKYRQNQWFTSSLGKDLIHFFIVLVSLNTMEWICLVGIGLPELQYLKLQRSGIWPRSIIRGQNVTYMHTIGANVCTQMSKMAPKMTNKPENLSPEKYWNFSNMKKFPSSSSKSSLSQSKDVPPPQSIENAHALLFLGDKVTTDHISPAGSIARVSAAAKYLQSKRSVSSLVAYFRAFMLCFRCTKAPDIRAGKCFQAPETAQHIPAVGTAQPRDAGSPGALFLHRKTISTGFAFLFEYFPSDWRRGSSTHTVLAEAMTRWWPEARSPASSSTIGSSADRARRLCTFLQARQWVHTKPDQQPADVFMRALLALTQPCSDSGQVCDLWAAARVCVALLVAAGSVQFNSLLSLPCLTYCCWLFLFPSLRPAGRIRDSWSLSERRHPPHHSGWQRLRLWKLQGLGGQRTIPAGKELHPQLPLA